MYMLRKQINKVIKKHQNQYKTAIKKVRWFLRTKNIFVGKHATCIKLFAHHNGLIISGNPKMWILDLYLSKTIKVLVDPCPVTTKKRKIANPNFLKSKKAILKHKFLKPVVGIYHIKCLINNKIYIGSSSNIEQRWLMHKFELKEKCHHNSRLQADYNEFGEAAFCFEVIWKHWGKIDRNVLYAIEQDHFDRLNPEYNILKIAAPPPGKTKRFYGHRKLKKPKLHAKKRVGSSSSSI